VKKFPLATNSRNLVSKKAYVDDGFQTYRNAPDYFASHDSGAFHQAALSAMLGQRKTSIAERMDKTVQKTMLENRMALKKFSQGYCTWRDKVLLSGDMMTNHQNFRQLLSLRCEDVPELKR